MVICTEGDTKWLGAHVISMILTHAGINVTRTQGPSNQVLKDYVPVLIRVSLPSIIYKKSTTNGSEHGIRRSGSWPRD